MDYRKFLEKSRQAADNFDYDKYLSDKEAGKLPRVEQAAKAEEPREGLMRRQTTAPTPSPEQAQYELGGVAERFIQLRKRRQSSGGGLLGGILEAVSDKSGGDGEGLGDLVGDGEGDGNPLAMVLDKTLGQSGGKTKGGFMSKKGDSGDFISRMSESESGGRSGVQITTKDGRKMTGEWQFSDGRLTDYKRATGEKFTTEQFRNDPALQRKVMEWHVADIDRVIDSLDAEGYDRDGLRAVAHLGGIGGMKKFVKTRGKYNPSDDFGTSLSKYYNKFSRRS